MAVPSGRVECPLCGVYLAPPPQDAAWEIPHTPWSYDCACTGRETCLYHRMHPEEERPKEPSSAEMLERATKRFERKVAEHQEKMARFAEYTRLRAEVARLRKLLEDRTSSLEDKCDRST